MTEETLYKSAQMTIDIDDYSVVNDLKRLLKHVQGVRKISVVKNYYDSKSFYQDLDAAEADIANGKGKTISSVRELDALFR